jgi:hypothetical protein
MNFSKYFPRKSFANIGTVFVQNLPSKGFKLFPSTSFKAFEAYSTWLAYSKASFLSFSIISS